jgi:hypothetical protein
MDELARLEARSTGNVAAAGLTIELITYSG